MRLDVSLARLHHTAPVAWSSPPAWVTSAAWLGATLLLAAALLASPAAGAEEVATEAGRAEALAREAVETYTRGLGALDRGVRREEFRRAHRLFASAASDGIENAALYTNIGNAALQAEDLGAAILAYRRALRVAPDHARATQNLEHARSLLPSWVPRPAPEGALDSFFFWHRTVPRGQREFGAAACFALAGALIALGIRFRQSALRNAAILPGIAWFALAASVLVDPVRARFDDAVVVLPEVVARAADSALAPSAFAEALPSGVEVRIVEDRSPWLRVRLASGRDAWLPESSVERVALSR